MQILPGDFLQNIWKDTFKIYADERMVNVKHERVQVDMNSVERSNRLFGNGWDKLVEDLDIVEEQLMVFTNLGDYKLSLALFFNNGRCMHEENILPTMLRLPPREVAPYAIEGITIFTFLYRYISLKYKYMFLLSVRPYFL